MSIAKYLPLLATLQEEDHPLGKNVERNFMAAGEGREPGFDVPCCVVRDEFDIVIRVEFLDGLVACPLVCGGVMRNDGGRSNLCGWMSLLFLLHDS